MFISLINAVPMQDNFLFGVLLSSLINFDLRWPYLKFNIYFILLSNIACTEFEPHWSKLQFNLTLTSHDLVNVHFVSYSPHIQVYSHQVWARSKQVEISPDLDLRWPWPISLLMSATCFPHIQVYFHQLWIQLEQVEFLLILNLDDLDQSRSQCSFHTPLMSSFIFNKFESHWSKLKFDVTFNLEGLTMRPSNYLTNIKLPYKHNHDLPQTKLHPPTKFQKHRAYHLWENRQR